MPDLSAISIFWACWDLHQNDEMLSDQNDRFSLNPANQRGPGNPDSEFELFSDRFERLFNQYSLDHELLMRTTETTPVINFKNLKSLFLS